MFSVIIKLLRWLILKSHKLAVHKGVKYSCGQCDYQATQQGNFQNHKLSVHEAVKYNCDQYDYQATQKGNKKNCLYMKEENISMISSVITKLIGSVI